MDHALLVHVVEPLQDVLGVAEKFLVIANRCQSLNKIISKLGDYLGQIFSYLSDFVSQRVSFVAVLHVHSKFSFVLTVVV